MKKPMLVATAALVALLLSAAAFAQSRTVTHSPSIHRGNHSQSAVRVPAQRTRVFPGTTINITGKRHFGHHRNHHRGHHGKHRFHGFHGHVHGTQCVFTAAHYTTEYRRVFVPGRYEKVYVPPTYATRIDHRGRAKKYLVANGYYKDVYREPHYETRPFKVYVPATWSCGFF